MSFHPEALSLLEDLFPFHIRLDRQGVIVGLGKSIRPLVDPGALGADFFSHFTAVRPETAAVEELFSHTNRVVLVQVRSLRAHLRGQFVTSPDGGLTFVGSPRIADAASRKVWPLGVVDFAPHDGTADYSMALEAHHMQVVQLQQLAEDLKEAERRARTQRERAEAASRAKADFLANISHEIRTPLANLVGYVEMLRGGALAEGEEAEALRVIDRNGEHLIALLGDVLEFSRLESGHLSLNRKPTDVAALVRDVVLAAQPSAREHQVELSLEVGGGSTGSLAVVVTDPVRVRQVVINLVSNAIKHAARGQVRVSLSEARWGNSAECRIEVRDTGPGIPEALLSAVFEPFSQLERGFTRAHGGVGLGLAISRKIAMALGGRLDLSSVVGEGSRFTFSFSAPIATPEQAAEVGSSGMPAPQVSAPSTAQPLHGRRVLVVEDSEDCLRLESRHLLRAGADVTTAMTGIDGVEAVREALAAHSPPHVILMDLHLPGIDGVEATRQIRGLGFTGRVVAITAVAERFHQERAMNAGCNDYRTKPLPKAELISACSANQDAL